MKSLLASLLLCGLAGSAAANTPTAAQARETLAAPRAFDGTPAREALPVPVPPRGAAAPADPEAVARQAQSQGAALTGAPIAVPPPAQPALKTWNPLLNGAKGAALGAIAGFALGGPLGMAVGAAVGGLMAWGMTKIGDA